MTRVLACQAVPHADPVPATFASQASPFPPIGEYAFLSDCHTGALVAPDGSVEWLCLPHFDSPSIFAALLDRGAGSFRIGPYGTFVPAGRRYEPGTNILETTWMTPTGWIVVRDALTVGDWHRNVRGTTHTRPPTDYDADHLLVRTVECIQGEVPVELVCEPRFDYGRSAARWTLGGEDFDIADATDGTTTFRLFTDLRLGVEGGRVRARHILREGERRFCALSWTEALRRSAHRRSGRPVPRPHLALLARLAGRRHLPGPSAARLPPALRARAQGPHLRADRRARRRADDVAARVARRRAQLGLPLLLDARRHVHALGPARARPGLGGRRLPRVRGRPRAKRGRLAPDHVRHPRPARARRADARPPQGLRGRAAGAGRQRRLVPAPERRLRRRARLRLPARQAARPSLRAALAGALRPGRVRSEGLEGARPGHLGGARRAASTTCRRS